MRLGISLGRAALVSLSLLSATTILFSGQTLAATTSSSQKLAISGTPQTWAQPGKVYAFQAKIDSRVDGRRVRFSVKNQPGWAFFSSFQGGLFGIPKSRNLGTYSNI